jgi:hypothetical protein
VADFGWPVVLGLLQVLVVVALVLVELAEPAPEPGFGGIAFSNAISSRRARAGVDLFRERLGWPAGDEAEGSWRVLSPAGYVWAKRAGVAALALVQLAALLTCLERRATDAPRRAWPWLIGPTLATLVLLAMPPVSTDLFSYAAAGNLARQGVNPYLTTPVDSAAGDPFAPFNDWAHIVTPYGPIWTNLSRLVVGLAGTDPFLTALGIKAVAGVSALGLGLVTLGLARRLTDDARLVGAAVVLVAWQPVLLLESAGSGHLDATMMLCALGGLLLISSGRRGGVRGGLALIAAGALVKPVVAPLLGLAALWRVAESRGAPNRWRTVIGRWLGDAAAIAAVMAVAFAPYWSGGDLLRTLSGESKRLYLDEALGVNAVWFWLLPRLPLVPEGDPWLELTDRFVRPATAAATLAVLTGTLLWLLARSWPWRRHRRGGARTAASAGGGLPDQVLAWAVAMAALGMLPVNAHAWYAIWPLAPVTLAWVATAPRRRRVPAQAVETDEGGRGWAVAPWWLWLFLIWVLGSFLVYHTHVWPGPDGT